MKMFAMIVGMATTTAEIRNGYREPSNSTFNASRGTHPMGEVFRIINESERAAVRMTVFLVNLSFYSMK